MAAGEGEEFVYRISTAEEWEYLQNNGSTFGGNLDKSSGFIHFSSLHQLQLGGELVYELVDGSNKFPHFYGPSRSFAPLPSDAVTKAERLSVVDGQFSCSLLNEQ
ncbi:boron transporter 1-like [Hibiscus syriacus]|uniref:Boron transporter 1-like n=1 Tax=Hibiscus syriacus TaxID=106335 RepID=A0A6A3A298_HIBSY|nr:boron transporter 1-like [Hibiscus syriacus]